MKYLVIISCLSVRSQREYEVLQSYTLSSLKGAMRSSSVIVVTMRSIFFIDQFLWHLITVNQSGTNFHLCPTGSQHVMSKCAHFHIWAMRMTHVSYWFITTCHGGREAGSNVFTYCHILGPFFSILDKSVWRRASFTLVSLLLYDMHVDCSKLQQTEPWSNSV